MIDKDLATLYDVQTKVLVQAVKSKSANSNPYSPHGEEVGANYPGDTAVTDIHPLSQAKRPFPLHFTL